MRLEPRQRRPDAELDAPDRVGLVGDGLLLAAAQVCLRVPQDLEEQLLLRVEVPVEDALADAEARRRSRPPTSGGSRARRSARRRTSISCWRRSSPRWVSRRFTRANGKQHLTERSRTPVVGCRDTVGRDPHDGAARTGRNTPFTGRSVRFRAMETLRRARVAARPTRRARAGGQPHRRGAGRVVGIDILERGAGRAIDELVVELPDGVPGRPARRRRSSRSTGSTSRRSGRSPTPLPRSPARRPRDGRDARRGGVDRTSCSTPCACTAPARWARSGPPSSTSTTGDVLASVGPAAAWLRPSWPAAAFVGRWPVGQRCPTTSCGRRCPAPSSPSCSGRTDLPFRARERRQVAALARIVDTRFREVVVLARLVRSRRLVEPRQNAVVSGPAPRPLDGSVPWAYAGVGGGGRRRGRDLDVELPVRRPPRRATTTRPRPARRGRRRPARSSPAPPAATPAPAAGRPAAAAAGPSTDAPPSARSACDVAARRRGHGVDDVAGLVGHRLHHRPGQVGPARAPGDARRPCPGRTGPTTGVPSPVNAGTTNTPSVSGHDAASGPISAASAMIPSPSRSHWTAAPGDEDRALERVRHRCRRPAPSRRW